MNYQSLPIACDCCFTTLGEAAMLIGPAFVYTLHVSPRALIETRTRLREWGADVRHNPMAPYINLEIDPLFGPHEWVLEANGARVGSRGV